MKSKATILAIVLLSSMLISCNENKKGLSNSTGGSCEIMVVTDNTEQWKGQIGDTIRHFFNQYLTGLPMPEVSFDATTTVLNQFNQNSLFRTHHAILIVTINPKAQHDTIEARANLWSFPQKVVKITAKSDTSFARIFTNYYPSMFKLYRDVEKERILKLFSTSPAKSISDKLKRNFGIDMVIPGGFAESTSNQNFIWIRQKIHRKKQDTELGFIIYTRPYKDTIDFSPKRIVYLRDSIVSHYIPGPSEGSYMITSTEVIPPEFKRTSNFSTGFAVETRGLWKVVHDFMGGPFISYTFIDKYTNNIVTAEGYLYSPGTEQRKFALQIEALLNTINVVDKKEVTK